MGLVYGVGINDANYPVTANANGTYKGCKFYQTWKGILERCYSQRMKTIRPSYEGCFVSPEWYRFSVFKDWMLKQKWEGKHLDKDLIVVGNKMYGPDTCVFVSQRVNSFVVGSVNKKNPELPPNITLLPSGSFRAGGTDEKGKSIYLGSSNDLKLAIQMVDAHKRNMAILLAEEENDEYVANLIRKRYL